MILTHAHAKGQGQRSASLKERVETDGQTDRWMETVGKYIISGKDTAVPWLPRNAVSVMQHNCF